MSTVSATDLDSINLDDVDLADPAVWEAGPPYELFARMQRDAPVHYSPQHSAPGEGGPSALDRPP